MRFDSIEHLKGNHLIKMLLVTMCNLKIIDIERPRSSKIAVIKSVRTFTWVLAKIGLIEHSFTLIEAKEYTQRYWPERYKYILYYLV